jgi:hypothetical protein
VSHAGITDIENIEYAKMSGDDMWRVNMIKEVTEVKFGQLSIEGFSIEECEEMLQFACISYRRFSECSLWMDALFPFFLIFRGFPGVPPFHKIQMELSILCM